MDRKRLRLTVCLLAAVALFVFAVPLPYRVICSLEVMPRDSDPVYVDVAGRVEEVVVRPGQKVHKGDPLARLTNVDLQLATAELDSKRSEYEGKLADLFYRRGKGDSTASTEIPQVKESLDAVKEQLQQKQQDMVRLSLVAPADGAVLPPPENPGKPDSNGQLPYWSGTPLDKKNVGAFMQESVLFCNIGDPKRLEAVLVVEQDDIEFIRENQSVAVKINEIPGWTYHTQIEEIAKNDLKVTPRPLGQKAGGEIVSKQDEGGTERPINTSYQARAPLDDNEGLLRIGLRGQAKIHARWQTLGYRGWRYLTRTFNFKL